MGTKQKLAEYPVKLRIKKGDEVMVIAGKDAKKSGIILKAFPSVNKIMVEGINMITKHQKARQTGKTGRTGVQEIQEAGRIKKPYPMSAAKVMLICPQCHKPTRVGYAFRDGEGKLSSRKYRVCKHPECGKAID